MTTFVRNRVIERYGDICIATANSRNGGFVGWAKRGEIVADGPMFEPGDPVWFVFAESRTEATAELLKGLKE